MSKKNIFGIGILIISIICFSFLFIFDKNGDLTKQEKETKILGVSETHGNYIYNKTFEELDWYADVIAFVKPTEEYTEREADIKRFDTGDIEQFATRTNVKIKKILKTNDNSILENKEMIIREPYARDGEQLLILNGYAPLKKGKTYIVFLKKGLVSDEYLITDINRGRYHITGKEVNVLEELLHDGHNHEQKGHMHGLGEEKRLVFNQKLNKKYEKEIKKQIQEIKSN